MTRPAPIHLDDAHQSALDRLIEFAQSAWFQRAVFLTDLEGGVRVSVWLAPDAPPGSADRILEMLNAAAGPFFTGDLWTSLGTDKSLTAFHEELWQEARKDARTAKVRIVRRYRTLGAWVDPLSDPVWELDEASPPIVTFYSFKGGVGRTTALAGFAIRRARAGDRVVVIDADLDAPGAGVLLSPDPPGAASPYGLIDYLVEAPFLRDTLDLHDYRHLIRRAALVGEGELVVYPAGTVDTSYLRKLALLDVDSSNVAVYRTLLTQVRDVDRPDWILVDARSGLSSSAGVLLSGISHMHVLIGTSSPQSWAGLRLAIRRLGADRLRSERTQAESLLVHAMVPAARAEDLHRRFAATALTVFTNEYYAENPVDPEDDQLWYIRDADEQGPSNPCMLSYTDKIANFTDVDEIANVIAAYPEYVVLEDRLLAIASRLRPEEEHDPEP